MVFLLNMMRSMAHACKGFDLVMPGVIINYALQYISYILYVHDKRVFQFILPEHIVERCIETIRTARKKIFGSKDIVVYIFNELLESNYEIKVLEDALPNASRSNNAFCRTVK